MIIVRLVFMKLNASSIDRPFNDFFTALVTSVHVNFSVIFTCLPFLKTVMDNIQTGLLAGDVHIGHPNQLSGYRLGKSANYPANGGMSITAERRNPSCSHGYLATIRKDSYRSQRGRGYSGASDERMVINQTTTISLKSDHIHEVY
jgi:hypothetical protein